VVARIIAGRCWVSPSLSKMSAAPAAASASAVWRARAPMDIRSISGNGIPMSAASSRATCNYDLQKDFEPIGLLSINPQLMVGRKNLPADDLKSLATWMKASPGQATLVDQLASAQLAGQLL
jgi:tripartite-type tricarboxylate transporter receptor subunit TctC